MRITKKPRSQVKASKAPARRTRRVMAEEMVEVAPEATELLFETEDVAELIAEVTDSEVVVDIDEETEEITFTVDEVPYTVEPEGTEEILESSRKSLKGKNPVKASRGARRNRAAN